MNQFERRCIYFDARNAKQLDQLSKAEGLNKSKLVNKTIEFYIANHSQKK